MRAMLSFLYGAACYVLFVITFLYMMGFVANLVVPKSIDSGSAGPLSQAILINLSLPGLFAVQHTIMARPAFKRWWTRFVPAQIERSTFVLVTCLILFAMVWQWRPMTASVWSIENQAARCAIWSLHYLGWAIVLYSSFLIDHFDLFGLRQVWLHLRGQPYAHAPFAMPWLYRLVRNPLMLGFLIAFWATPEMTQGHLLFDAATTGYILIGIQFEERDLIRILGEDYRRHRANTPMLLPRPRRRPVAVPAPVHAEAGPPKEPMSGSA